MILNKISYSKRTNSPKLKISQFIESFMAKKNLQEGETSKNLAFLLKNKKQLTDYNFFGLIYCRLTE